MRDPFIAVEAATGPRAHAPGQDGLEAARAASPLGPAIDTLRRCLCGFAQDAGHVMVVVDAAGRILWTEGDRRVRLRADGIPFAIDHAVQFFSADHDAWWCSAPVHDPLTGELLGVVDLSGPMRTASPHNLALVTAATEMAEHELRFRRTTEERPAAVARPSLRLRVLGHGAPTAEFGGGAPFELGYRHAEILALLAMHPDGLTGEQLTLELYGEQGNPITTRAELSRLRKLLPCVAARPYRLQATVSADFLDIEAQLAAGELGAALTAYRGPLLPLSEAPGIAQARNELEGALQRAARRGSADQLWTWLQTAPGREDPLAMAAFVRRLEGDDPRRAIAAARLRALQVRWRA